VGLADEAVDANITVGGLTKLALFGGIAGPLADGVHNQALLQYDVGAVGWQIAGWSLQTSVLVPFLLAFAYPVLGVFVPRVLKSVLPEDFPGRPPLLSMPSRETALAAVTSTLVILKVSEILEQSSDLSSALKLVILSSLAVAQWLALDGSLVSFCSALLAGIAGPLAELPFLAAGFWHYLPAAVDYMPLAGFDVPVPPEQLGLSSLTGPCYFAVTTDSIAWWRFFQATSSADKGVRHGALLF